MTAHNHWANKLAALYPCASALVWAHEQPSAASAWATCQRGDWMLWIAGKLAGPPGSDARRPLTLAACACARLALPYMYAGEDRPRIAIETAEGWARSNEGPTQQVRDAASGAYAADAASAAYAACVADAADASAYAASAASGAAYVVSGAAYAAAYAVSAASGACAADAAFAAAYAVSGGSAAVKEALAKCADIVREHYPQPPKL